jgi:hypothetical protein
VRAHHHLLAPSSREGSEKEAKTAGKKKKKQVSVPHDNPAMGTGSKTTPASKAVPHIQEVKESFHCQI